MFNQRRSYHQQNSSYTGVGAFSSAPAPSNSALAAASVIGQALKANNNNPTGLNIPPIQQRRNSLVSQSRSGSLQSHQSRNIHGSIGGRSSSRTNSFLNSNNDNSNQRRNSVTSARPASVIGTSRLNVKRSTPNLGRRSVSDFHNYTPNTPNNVNSLPKTVKKWIPSANGLVCVEIPNPKHPENQAGNHVQNQPVKRSVSLSSSNHHAYPTRSGSIVRNNSGFLTRRRSVAKSITKSTKVLNNGNTVETTTVEQIVDEGNNSEHEDQHYANFDSDQPQVNSLDTVPLLNEIEEDDNEDDAEVKKLDSSKFNNKKLGHTHSKFKKISPSKSKFEVDYDDDDVADYGDNDNIKLPQNDEIIDELGEERIKEEKVKNMIAKNEEIEKIQRERAFSSINGPIEDTVKIEDDLTKPIIEDAAVTNDETEDEEYTEEEKRLAELRLEELVKAKEQEILDGLIKNGHLQNKDDDSMNTVVSECEDGDEKQENKDAQFQIEKQNIFKNKQPVLCMEEVQYSDGADGEISNIDDSLTQNEIIPMLEQNTSRTEPLNLNEESDNDYENEDSSIVSSENNEYMDTQADESSESTIIKNPLLSHVGRDKEDHSPKKSMAERLRPGLTISPVNPSFEGLEIPKRSPEIQARVDDLQNKKPFGQRSSMIISSSEQSKRKSVLKNSKEPARYSMYNSPSTSGAYLSLATAENTRLNAMASSSTGSFQQQVYVSPPLNQRNSVVGHRQSLNNLQDAPPPLAAATRAAQKHSNQANQTNQTNQPNQTNQLSSYFLRNSASTPNIRKSQMSPAKPKQQQKRLFVERPAQKRAKELYELSKTRPVIQSSDLLKLDSEDQRRSSFEKISETNSASPQKKDQQRLTLRDGVDPEEIMIQQNVDLSNNKRFASTRGYKSRFGDSDSDLEIPIVSSIKNNVSAEPPSSNGINIFKSKFRSEKRNSSIPNSHAASAASTPINMNFAPQNIEYANGNGKRHVNVNENSNDHHPNVSEFSSKFQHKFFSEPHNHRNVSGGSHTSAVSTVAGGEKKPRFGKLKKLFGSKKN